MTRAPFATIDLGTNSVLLTLARRAPSGELIVVEQDATVTRLGQGVDQSRKLHPEAQQRTLDCLRAYRKKMDSAGVLFGAAVGTSALRDAAGGEDFVETASAVLGFPLRVISGDREAQLTFRGALSGLPQEVQSALVFDIGGGSTELIIGNQQEGRVDHGLSLNVGSVRLTERLALTDPPGDEALEQLRGAIAKELARFSFDQLGSGEFSVVGVAGTVTSVAAIALGLSVYDSARIHGAVVQPDELHALATRIFSMPVARRLELPGLNPGRADVIGAGAILCSMIVERAGNRPLLVSDRGVRFGLLEELAAKHPD